MSRKRLYVLFDFIGKHMREIKLFVCNAMKCEKIKYNYLK